VYIGADDGAKDGADEKDDGPDEGEENGGVGVYIGVDDDAKDGADEKDDGPDEGDANDGDDVYIGADEDAKDGADEKDDGADELATAHAAMAREPQLAASVSQPVGIFDMSGWPANRLGQPPALTNERTQLSQKSPATGAEENTGVEE